MKSIKRKLEEIHTWWKYCVNKIRLHYLKKYLFDNYPWDYGYLYELQEGWLEEALAYYGTQYKDLLETDADLKDKVRWISIAYSLVRIILERDNLYHVVGRYDSTDYNDYTIVPDVYVNLRNKRCFKYRCANWGQTNANNIPVYKYDDKLYEVSPIDLYQQKAKYLYHKIMYEHSDSWWD